jgi:nitrate reductase NapD
MPECNHVSSLLLRADPAHLETITNTVAELPGIEVQITDQSGRIIVTLETASDGHIVEMIDRINRIEGMVSAALVYHEIADETLA